MNRITAALAVSLSACGSGEHPPLFGGFTTASGAAVILAPSNCNVAFVGNTALSGVLVELTTRADACNVLTEAKQCGTGASSTTVLAGAFSGVVGATSVGPSGPGSYPFLPNPPTGTFKAATTAAAQVDATCTAPSGATASMSSGSITIATLDASTVSGAMDMQFDNGQAYKGSFAVPVCPVSIDICSLFAPCTSRTCVP